MEKQLFRWPDRLIARHEDLLFRGQRERLPIDAELVLEERRKRGPHADRKPRFRLRLEPHLGFGHRRRR